jgi:hypothetical protein
MIVLRTFILPMPSEVSIREHREIWYQANVSQHAHPANAGSVLKDLPIDKALNSYSKVIDGRVVPINGGPKGPNDRFYFRFFLIPHEYVDKINGIMLNESHQIDLIVFNNKASTFKTLEHYMAHCGEFGGDVDRIRNLEKLQQAAKLLGETLPKQETPKPQQNMILGVQVPEDKVLALFAQNKKAKELYFELSKYLEYQIGSFAYLFKVATQQLRPKTSVKLVDYSTCASTLTPVREVSLNTREKRRAMISSRCTTVSRCKSFGSTSNEFDS